MRNALAICCRISADGLRNPRSIWLRYGFEMPAMSDSFRRDNRATRRCSRMNSPRSRIRVSRSFMGLMLTLASRMRLHRHRTEALAEGHEDPTHVGVELGAGHALDLARRMLDAERRAVGPGG